MFIDVVSCFKYMCLNVLFKFAGLCQGRGFPQKTTSTALVFLGTSVMDDDHPK